MISMFKKYVHYCFGTTVQPTVHFDILKAKHCRNEFESQN